MTPEGFNGIRPLIEADPDQARKDLATYFTTHTGRWFEHFSAASDPDHLDANDIAACSALSVPVEGPVLQALFERRSEIDAYLAKAPKPGEPLWEVDPESSEYRAMSDLYDLVRRISGMGVVLTSKLLACKRPHFVPIRDSIVEGLLGKPSEWWAPWQTTVADGELRNLIEKITPDNVPPNTSILRRLDVILWMHGTRRAKATG
jgi:hypothetical protein